MGIELFFTRDLTLAAIKGIEEYHLISEDGISESSKRELNRIKDIAQAKHWEYDDWDIARQEHEITFEMMVPNYFRYSCIVLVCSVLESKLKEMCDIVSEHRNEPPQEFKNAFIRNYKNYLSKTISFSTPLWNAIEDLNKVRNCIAHASGKVGSKHEHIRHLAKTGLGIGVSGNGSQTPDNLLPLYLEDNRVVIESKYCQWIIKTVYAFFEELFVALQKAGVFNAQQ